MASKALRIFVLFALASLSVANNDCEENETEFIKEIVALPRKRSNNRLYIHTCKNENRLRNWILELTPTDKSVSDPFNKERRLSSHHHFFKNLQPDTEYVAMVYSDRREPISPPRFIRTEPKDEAWVNTTLGSKFLEQMKTHFARSTEYLIMSFRMKGKAYERPGLANTLKEESDRKWALGLGLTQKYFQRGGRFNNYLKDNYKIEMSLPNSHHQNPLERNDHYLSLVQQLKSNSDKSNRASTALSKHKSATYDADISHYLQEVGEKERSSLRKHTVMMKNLEKLIKNGMAMSLFDKSL